MSSRASCIDGPLTCLTIVKRVLTLETPSTMPSWAPLVSFSPNRRRFWSPSAGCSTPQGTRTPIPCETWSRFPVTRRSARGVIRSHRAREPVCVEVFEGLVQRRMLTHVSALGDQRLVALDGTTSFSSHAMHCQPCRTRQRSHGHPLASHAALTPVMVGPGQSQGIALPPESIMPQDGPGKQDWARAAGTRWLDQHAEQVAAHGVTCLGDTLSSHQPLCALVFQPRCTFSFPCQPDSHPTL